MFYKRKCLSSLDLPDQAPTDYTGVTIWCSERGLATPAAYTPWIASGGAWLPLGPSYVGVLSGLPAAANVRIGCKAVIDQPAVSLTRSSAQGTKMQRVNIVCKYLPDGVTKSWFPDGAQTLWTFGGSSNVPALAPFTAAGATGLIGEFGQLPAGFLSTIRSTLKFSLEMGRTAPNAATATVSFALGATSGTPGTAVGVVTGLNANVNAVAYIDGSMWVQDTTHQTTTFALPPQSTGTTGASGIALTLNLAVAQTLQAVFSAATAGDNLNCLAAEFSIL